MLLIAVTGAMGWLGFNLRQQAAEEDLRVNTLVSLVQEVRGDLYRQMSEVFDHTFLGEPTAVTEYLSIGQRISRTFLRMDSVAVQIDEVAAVDELRAAYQEVRGRADTIMATPSRAIRQADQLAVFVTGDLRMDWVSDFERVLAATDGLLRIAQTAGDTRTADLNRNVGIVLAIPIVLASLLLLASRGFLRQAFVRPLRGLLQGLEAFARGNLDHKVPEAGAAELVTLERAVNDMARDLAQSREAQVQAERQAALGALVPVVAHNIRNPLASIRATAQVHEGGTTPPEVTQGLRDIRITVDRLERWLSALLSYLNPLRLARVNVRVADVADQAVKLLAPRLEPKRITVRRDGWDLPAYASLDVHLMEQAVYGLLTNAIDASPDGAAITLTVRAAGDSVQLVIGDRGAGMPFRPAPGDLNPGPTTKSYGSGLGIPFAFKVCGLHHGMLEFATRDGGGTEVILTVPATEGARTAA